MGFFERLSQAATRNALNRLRLGSIAGCYPGARRLRVVYLLEGVALYGGVKVVLQHVRALRRVGVDAIAVSPEPAPYWFPALGPGYRQQQLAEIEKLRGVDIAIATMWSTIEAAMRVPGARPFHLCQCYEGLYEGVRDLWPAIEASYRLPTRKLAVSPHLVELIARRFGQDAAWIPQPFEAETFTPEGPAVPRGDRFRVLVVGHWDVPIKGIEWGLRALRPLADEGWLELVRLSLETHPDEAALWPDAERWIALSPVEVPPVVRSVDAYLCLSTEVEGFGLPTLEAMGCAVPVVSTDIPATRALDPAGAATLRVAVGDSDALRSAVRRLRDEPALGRELGRAGRALSTQFSAERTTRALLAAFGLPPSGAV
jgi:glycosyltransferase involved in cell wall biosynthesis